MLWGFTTSFLLLFALLIHNWGRSRLSVIRELKPNCLLTQNPLVFISGQRSLFYFLAYWNQIPHWLASHGYEVFHLPLPWMNEKKRLRFLHRFLVENSQTKSRIHLIVDQSSLKMMKILLSEQSYPCLASVTLVGQDQQPVTALSSSLLIPIEELEIPLSTAKAPLFWFFHQLWTSQWHSLHQLGWKMTPSDADLFLQRAQFLAERDLLQKQSSPTLET